MPRGLLLLDRFDQAMVLEVFGTSFFPREDLNKFRMVAIELLPQLSLHLSATNPDVHGTSFGPSISLRACTVEPDDCQQQEHCLLHGALEA
jgi:hypothetical protein